MQPCPRALQPSFVVLRQTSAAAQPAEPPLDDPASRKHLEILRFLGFHHDLEVRGIRHRGQGLGPLGAVVPPSAQTFCKLGRVVRSSARTAGAPSRSCTGAGCTGRTKGNPRGSTPACRVLPWLWFPPSCPLGPPLSVVFTDGRSIPPPAVGVEHRPSRARAGPRNAATRSPYRPWSRHQYKEYRTVEGAETPGGSARHWQPVIHGYGSACTPSRRDLPHGDDPLRNGQGRAAPCPLTGALSRVSSSAQRVPWCARTSRQRTAVFRVRQGHACSNLSLDPFPRVRNTRPRNHQCVPLCRVARQIEQPDTRQGVAPCARRIGGTPCFRTGGCNGPVPAGAGTPRSRTHAC